jgi:predicted outer membrane protein
VTPERAVRSAQPTSTSCLRQPRADWPIELGKLAQHKASSQEAKDFAQKMVEDHSKANDELKETAQKVGTSCPIA